MSLLKTFLELRGQSAVVQDSFRRELITEATLPMSFAVMEGGFIGVIADKLYQVSPWVIAVITAAPMFSNLSSFLWAKLIKGRPKVPVIVLGGVPAHRVFRCLQRIIVIIGARRFILGIARGGGSLAWNLGHNDFASQKLLAAYMGAHVTLTGIRGAIAPFVGILLYLGWSDVAFLPDFEGIGVGVFLLAACFSSLSWWGYRGMGRALTASQLAVSRSEEKKSS